MIPSRRAPLRALSLPLCLLLSALSLPAHAGWFDWLFKDTYTETRYPIVLSHGLFGFDDIAGYNYWYRIPEELRRSGAQVYVTQVAAANSTEVRGEQLARQVEAILAATGADKVNLIGHSHGGPTVRYVASVYPDYIASATAVAGPHTGARMADVLLGVQEALPLAGDFLGSIVNAATGFLDLISGGGYEQDSLAALYSLSTPGSTEFNSHYPEGLPEDACGHAPETADNGVRYYSWSGAKPLTNVLDISDAGVGLLALLYLGEKNDGLVSSCSSHLGLVIRDYYRMNHLDEVNQIAGLVSPFETNPTAVFRQHANRLKNRGL
ncbi:MAG: triacylglycerol lipase [Alcanivorax sp.]|nr:triacylglycerol lipase [Alcanivorax sp.]